MINYYEFHNIILIRFFGLLEEVARSLVIEREREKKIYYKRASNLLSDCHRVKMDFQHVIYNIYCTYMV